MEMIRERKRNKNTKEYDRLNNLVKSSCREAKEKMWQERCEKIERLDKQNLHKELHQETKALCKSSIRKQSSGCIADKEGNILFDEVAKEKRWMEYISELYDDIKPNFLRNKSENS